MGGRKSGLSWRARAGAEVGAGIFLPATLSLLALQAIQSIAAIASASHAHTYTRTNVLAHIHTHIHTHTNTHTRPPARMHTLFPQVTLDSREQLESLQGLIDRVTFNPQQSQRAGPNVKSTSALLAQLQSAAAQY